ncbi:MAG: flagellar motor switch phosphatase FliY [Lachnospiraceae bacterium]|nr:flagellar motor switch phosphatase FliY [Lachnospiraceae bacterium]
MDGMLSQDEINALLSGMAADSEFEATTEASSIVGSQIDENLLTETEKDAIGEVANISMGTSATTLYSLVNRKVDITTPVVSLATWENVLEYYEKPCVFIQIKYTTGLDGHNILILKEHDVKVITDLMMGGDGTNTDGELGELHLSAISEAMNQMMGSAATSLSQMLGSMIDISPPEASLVDLQDFRMGEEIANFLAGTFVKIAFKMQIGDLVDSTILQLYPVDFAKELVATFLGEAMGDSSAEPAPVATPEPTPMASPMPDAAPQMMPGMDPAMGQMPNMGMPGMDPAMGQMPNMGMPYYGYPGMPNMGMPGMMPYPGMPNMGMPAEAVNYQPAQFQSFSTNVNPVAGNENINLIMDVPLQVTVELGRTTKSIAEILDFSPGTIIELEKLAGEPVDVLVNGKFVAKGEVVVIEESFGIRVTEIIK